MKISPHERTTLGIVALILLGLLGCQFITPLFTHGNGVHTPAIQVPLTKVNALLAEGPAIRKYHEALSEAMVKAEKRFLPDADVESGQIDLLALVEKAAEQSDFVLNAKGPFAWHDQAPPVISVEVAGSGDTRAAIKFMRQIMSGDYRLEFERLDLTIGDKRLLQLRATVATMLPKARGGNKDGK